MAVLFFASGISFIAWLILKVQKGEGADLYFTGWGYKVSPLGVLGFLFAFVIAILIGYIFQYYYKNEEKDFLSKYGKKDKIKKA